jgi:hypothetical protein
MFVLDDFAMRRLAATPADGLCQLVGGPQGRSLNITGNRWLCPRKRFDSTRTANREALKPRRFRCSREARTESHRPPMPARQFDRW